MCSAGPASASVTLVEDVLSKKRMQLTALQFKGTSDCVRLRVAAPMGGPLGGCEGVPPEFGRRLPITRLPLVLLLLACTQVPRDQTISSPAAHSRKFEADTTLRGWTASDSAALALGLGMLRQASLPDGTQEVRIWTGLALGVPHNLLRLTRRGGRVEGLKALYWSLESGHPNPGTGADPVPIDAIVRYHIAGRCGPPKRVGGVEACQVHFTQRPDWRALWDSLEALGVWTLPDQDDLPRDSLLTLDGWAMTVEVRDGGSYRSYAYSNPDAHRHPAQVAAAAIGRVDGHLWSLVPRPGNERRYRGRLDVGVGWSEFRVCGTNAIWGVQGRLGARLDSLRTNAAGQDSTARHIYYADLRGMLAYPGLAGQWDTPYSEILQVDSVLTTHATVPEHC